MSTLPFDEFPQLHQERFFQIQSDLGDEFPRFLTLFAEHSQSLLATIDEGLASNDMKQVKASLHSFKGMSGSMGANRLYHLCKQAETLAGMDELITLQQLISQMQTELPKLEQAIKQALQTE